MKQKITEKILIGDLIEKYPRLAETLVETYDLHCIGCMASSMETLEEGAMVHGMNKKEIKKMIKNLNSLIK